MTKTEFLEELDQLLGFQQGTLKGGESLSEMTLWDSMGRLSFILLAEEKLGYVVDGSSVVEARTTDDLLKLVHGKIQDV